MSAVDEELLWHQQQCANKIPYVSRQEAKHVAKRVTQSTGRRSDVYRCQICEFFHTTSLSKQVARRAKQAVRRELAQQ